MQTFLITARLAQNEAEFLITAATVEQAIKQGKALAIDTLGWDARWVHAFA